MSDDHSRFGDSSLPSILVPLLPVSYHLNEDTTVMGLNDSKMLKAALRAMESNQSELPTDELGQLLHSKDAPVVLTAISLLSDLAVWNTNFNGQLFNEVLALVIPEPPDSQTVLQASLQLLKFYDPKMFGSPGIITKLLSYLKHDDIDVCLAAAELYLCLIEADEEYCKKDYGNIWLEWLETAQNNTNLMDRFVDILPAVEDAAKSSNAEVLLLASKMLSLTPGGFFKSALPENRDSKISVAPIPNIFKDKITESHPSTDRLCDNCHQSGHKSNACPSLYSASSKQCYGCGGIGHVRSNCPALKLQGTTSQRKCYTCGEVGHIAEFCTSRGGALLPSESSRPPDVGYTPVRSSCYRCGGFDHIARDCLAAPGYGGGSRNNYEKACYKCGENGHIAKDCLQY